MAQTSLELAENANSDVLSGGVGSFDERHISSLRDVDWRRLKGYKAACNIKKNPSWIWQHGYRLWNEVELEYWLCTRCHHGPVKRPFPKGHIFQTTRATSTAAQHMVKTALDRREWDGDTFTTSIEEEKVGGLQF